jgi:hypothetical protein
MKSTKELIDKVCLEFIRLRCMKPITITIEGMPKK